MSASFSIKQILVEVARTTISRPLEYWRPLLLAALLLSLFSLTTTYPVWTGPQPVLFSIAVWIGYAYFFVVFGIACHRAMLLDPPPVRLTLRWSFREIQFLLFIIGTSVIVMVILWFAGLLVFSVAGSQIQAFMQLRNQDTIPPLFFILPFVFGAPAYYVLARLSLVFPATALDKDASLGWAWKAGQGNGWRLFVLVALLPGLGSMLNTWLIVGDLNLMKAVANALLNTVLLYFGVAVLSCSYKALASEDLPPL